MTGSCPESFPSAASSAPRPPPSKHANTWNASFPAKLHLMLEYSEQMGLSHVVSWLPHGRAFRIHDEALFMSCIAGRFFKATKLRSIHRQLNLWGFRRAHSGEVRDAWNHEHFTRGRLDDILKMVRTKHKGGTRRRLSPPAGLLDDAPDSYRVPHVLLVKAEGAPATKDACLGKVEGASATDDRSAKAEENSIASATDIDGGRKPPPDTVSSAVRPARPSSPLPLPRLELLALTPTWCRDQFGPHRVSARTIERLQNWTVERLPVGFGNEKSRCDVGDDEFSLFIGMLIKDPSQSSGLS